MRPYGRLARLHIYASAALDSNVRFRRIQGRCSGAGAVLVAVPGGSAAYVPGAVSGIESGAVIDGTSLSGAMSRDRFALSSAYHGARRSRGAGIGELAGRAGLQGARLARG